MNKVALIGLGAMGTFFAGGLHDLLQENFVVIAQGKRKERLERGMVINGRKYNFRLEEPGYKDFVADLIIVATKMPQLDEALDQIDNYVGEKTQIMTVLNGIQSEEKAIVRYGENRVVYSYMRVSNQIIDGVANFDSWTGRVFVGEARNEVLSDRIKKINGLFTAAGIKYINDRDMIKSMWHKYMCNIGENLTCALVDVPFGSLTNSSHIEYMRYNLMKEVVVIANAKGIDLKEADIVEQGKKYVKWKLDGLPSTLQDLRAGRKTEVDMFAGHLVELGRQLNIPTPLNEFIWHAIKAIEEKNTGKFDF